MESGDGWNELSIVVCYLWSFVEFCNKSSSQLLSIEDNLLLVTNIIQLIGFLFRKYRAARAYSLILHYLDMMCVDENRYYYLDKRAFDRIEILPSKTPVLDNHRLCEVKERKSTFL